MPPTRIKNHFMDPKFQQDILVRAPPNSPKKIWRFVKEIFPFKGAPVNVIPMAHDQQRPYALSWGGSYPVNEVFMSFGGRVALRRVL